MSIVKGKNVEKEQESNKKVKRRKQEVRWKIKKKKNKYLQQDIKKKENVTRTTDRTERRDKDDEKVCNNLKLRALGDFRMNRTIQYNTIQYNTIQYNTIQYTTILYNTI